LRLLQRLIRNSRNLTNKRGGRTVAVALAERENRIDLPDFARWMQVNKPSRKLALSCSEICAGLMHA